MAKEHVIVDDLVTYTTWDERLRQYVHHKHKRGAVVELPDEVVARLERIPQETDNPRDKGRPRIIPKDDYEGWVSEQAFNADPAQRFTDDQLMAMSGSQLIAELNSTPGLAERVLPLEKDRRYTRKPVVEHCERLLAAGDGEDVSLGDSRGETLTPSQD